MNYLQALEIKLTICTIVYMFLPLVLIGFYYLIRYLWRIFWEPRPKPKLSDDTLAFRSIVAIIGIIVWACLARPLTKEGDFGISALDDKISYHSRDAFTYNFVYKLRLKDKTGFDKAIYYIRSILPGYLWLNTMHLEAVDDLAVAIYHESPEYLAEQNRFKEMEKYSKTFKEILGDPTALIDGQFTAESVSAFEWDNTSETWVSVGDPIKISLAVIFEPGSVQIETVSKNHIDLKLNNATEQTASSIEYAATDINEAPCTVRISRKSNSGWLLAVNSNSKSMIYEMVGQCPVGTFEKF